MMVANGDPIERGTVIDVLNDGEMEGAGYGCQGSCKVCSVGQWQLGRGREGEGEGEGRREIINEECRNYAINMYTGHGTWDMGHGTRDTGHGTWDTGHGTRDMGHVHTLQEICSMLATNCSD